MLDHRFLGVRRRLPRNARLASLVFAWMAASISADAAAPTVTIAEGKSTIFSGDAALVSSPGAQLHTCDIVRTRAPGMMQIEYEDGGRIVLGPDSRLVFDVPLGGDPVVGPHFLISGWAKLTVPKRDKAAPYRIDTPQFDLVTDGGVVTLRVGDNDAAFFVEQGSVTALLPAGRSMSRVLVGTGRTFTRKGAGDRGTMTDRADPAFVQAMPTAFRDTLPSLLANVKGRNPPARPSPGDNVAEAEGWLRSAPELGACIVDPTVRAAQRTLENNGFEVGPIDGILGPRTQAALRAFQESQGLARSGRLDADTLKALENPKRP
jgi:hypothetical protein